MNKNLLIILIIFLTSIYSSAQSDSEIDRLIDSLSWESVHIVKSSRTSFASCYEPFVSELVKIGRPAAEKLFKSISNPEKTVIIHMILTKLFEPEKNYFYPFTFNYNCTYKLKDLGLHFIFNGLVWDCIYEDKCSIQDNQIDRIKSYWDRKLHDSQNSFTIDPEDLLTEICKRDSINYNCFDSKTYKNNSSSIDFKDLQKLFTVNFPNPLFDKIFNLLGNDSIYWRFERGSYITYFTDGIEFDIDENKLRRVYFKAYYEGTLINELKMSDNRDAIIVKLGKPEIHKAPRYEFDWDYSEYGLSIAFGDANRIIDLQMKMLTNTNEK